jgi:hypothetical protein
VGKAEGKKPRGRPSVDGRIILCFKEIGLEGVDWINMYHDLGK